MSNGAAIQNVTVVAVTRVGNSFFTRTATTDATGAYRLAGLPAGTYWVYTSNAGLFLHQFRLGHNNAAGLLMSIEIP